MAETDTVSENNREIPATEKLYDLDAYATEFTAHVLSARDVTEKRHSADAARKTAARGKTSGEGKNSGASEDRSRFVELVLNRTLFFPEEGGQTPDRGKLGRAQVVDVQIHDGVITHLVRCSAKRAAGIVPGLQLRGVIDWAHRYSNMQMHSGEHIVSGLIHRHFGYDNIGFRLADDIMTVDLSGFLNREEILQIEREANEAVWKNLHIHCEYPDREKLEKLDYRSKREIDGPVRIVTIPGVDVCACCAPHVARTGEIGLIKIVHAMNNARRGSRLTVVCGSRALREMEWKQTAIEEVSHLTNKSQEDIAQGVQHLLDENASLKYRANALEQRMAKMLLDRVPADAPHVWLFEDEMNSLTQRNLVNSLCAAHEGCCGVFAGSDEDGWHYIIGSGKVGEDAREPNRLLREHCGARGGGKPQMVQGSVHASRRELERVLNGEKSGV